MDSLVNARQLPFYAGRYRCEEYLGGGMADVYRARDTELPRDVAIKILKPSNQGDAEVRASFLDEVQLASSCSHENIVMTYDKGEFEGSPFIVMEFLRGENLDTVIRNHGQGDLRRILLTALQIARALKYVHSQNIVHRDLKPQNLHVDQNGRLRLVDFGIAKAVDWNKTQAGMVKGTAYYMSPEQIMGEPVTFHTDIWAFGVVLYELLCDGQRPFQGTTLDGLWAAIVNGAPKYHLLTESHVPESVIKIVRRCLEKKAEDRYSSFDPVIRDIETTLDELSPSFQTTTLQVGPAANTQGIKSLTTWMVTSAIAVALISLSVLVYYLVAERKPVKQPPELAKQLSLPSGDMVLVGAGPALVGADKHRVDLKAFYIDRTEVSNRAYAQFVKEKSWRKPKDFAEDKPDYPVVNVSYLDALAFAKWAGKRLPTEEEWEKAARGTMGQLYPWGNAPKPELANVSDNPLSKHSLMPVMAFAAGASPYGALNMCGNVWEWVDTDQKPTPDFLKRMQKELDTKLSQEDAFYVIRGGYFQMPLSPELISENAAFPARLVGRYIGFRCAKTPDAR